jgi:glucose-6-phosphate isomerase
MLKADRFFQSLTETEESLADDTWLNDELRHEDCLLSACNIDLFFGRFPIGQASWECLLQLPDHLDLKRWVQKLFSGGVVNASENLAATHTKSREDYVLSSPNLLSFRRWMTALHQGRLPDGDVTIEDVIHLGTGGSRLGPELLIDALKTKAKKPFRPHFVSGHEASIVDQTLAKCNPEKTLVIIASKSFSTTETLENASICRAWLQQFLTQEQSSQRLLAITAEAEKALAWGIDTNRCMTFEKTISGRYSISSVISLIAAAYLGEPLFSDFILGMIEMDQHFVTSPWQKNMPVIYALLDAYSMNALSIPTRTIIPYTQNLATFIPYIQQLVMESLGKNNAFSSTSPIVWGGVGFESEHSFYQLIMQGTHRHLVEFIIPKNHVNSWQNALAQAQLMQRGNGLVGNIGIKGGNPSLSLFIPSVNPHSLGALIALYEHQCFVQSVFWEINCFDQPGVEAGKQLTRALAARKFAQSDRSTQKLLSLCCASPIPTEEVL